MLTIGRHMLAEMRFSSCKSSRYRAVASSPLSKASQPSWFTASDINEQYITIYIIYKRLLGYLIFSCTSRADSCQASQLIIPFVQLSGFDSIASTCSQYLSSADITSTWLRGDPNSIASVTFSRFVLFMVFWCLLVGVGCLVYG